MRYDITLRSLVGQGAPALLGATAGMAALELLPGEFPTSRERRADVVARLVDGRILHLEFQTQVDRGMPWRMLEYHALIAAAHDEAELLQIVLQVGNETSAVCGLERQGLQFRYRVLNLRDFDPAPFLASPAPSDNILAFLCRSDDIRERIRQVLSCLERLEDKARSDAAAQLLALSGLRGASALVLKEISTMPITINLEDNPYLLDLYLRGMNKGREEGREEGREAGREAGREEGSRQSRAALARTLLKVLERRFGPLEAESRERVLAADQATLERWSDLVFEVAEPAALFLPAKPH
jgi:predicted transposase YdaD